MSQVTILKTKPETILKDYKTLMQKANYHKHIKDDTETLLKLNLSWSLYYPACSTQPWQLEGVIKTMRDDNYKNITATENKTVVTQIAKGVRGNKWGPIMYKYKVPFVPLTEVEWTDYKPQGEMLALDKIFPEGHKIPQFFIGKNVIHLPTMKCVHPDTEIFRDDGSIIKINDLVESIHEAEEIINEGSDLVSLRRYGIISLTGKGIKKTSASHFWKTKNTENLMYLKLKTGKAVKTSKKHPFLTQRGWIEASKLNKSDRIAIPRMIDIEGKQQEIPDFLKEYRTPSLDQINFINGKKHSLKLQRYVVEQYTIGRTLIELSKELELNPETLRNFLKRYGIPIRGVRKIPKIPETTTPELWEWFGLLLSEGYVYDCNGSLRTSLSNNNALLISRYAKLTEKLFRLKPKIRNQHDRVTECYFDSNLMRSFYQFLEIFPPTNSATKLIPQLLFKCTKEEIGAFLSGYIDGDGTIGKDGLHITSKSSELIRKIQLLIIRLGAVSFIHKGFNRATNSKMDKELYYTISIYGEELVNFSKYLRLNTSHKKENIQKLKERRRNSKKKYNWDTIPINRAVFRTVREGLGISQNSSGKPSGVNSIENGYSLPTRNVITYFIELFERLDKNKKFSNEIKYLKFMTSQDIAWDHIKVVKEIEPDVPYLYDLSVPEYNNFIGNGIILHNTHGHTSMTGAIKNAFGGLITEQRHHCHKMIHEVLVDLLTIQKEIHKGIFAIMDGTVAGDGAGPRTMHPKIKNYILASHDQVAIDAIAAKMMGFDPLKIPFIKMAHDKGLGMGDTKQIEIIGEDVTNVNFHFKTSKSPIIAGDQLLRKGALSSIEPLLFHTGLFNACIFASAFYHDKLWYHTIGKQRIKEFNKTEWGKLFKRYT